MRSIRARTTVTAVLVMAVAMTGAAIALVVLLRASMLRGLDSHARLRLQDVAGLAQRGALPITLAGTDEDGTVAQLVVNGRVVAESAVVRGSAPLANFVPPRGRVARNASRTAERSVRPLIL